MISYRITLLVCLPFSLYTMDQTKESALTIQQKRDLQCLYKTTYKYFQNLTPIDSLRYVSLLEIISETTHLNKQGLTETDMRQFSFEQKESVSDRIRNEIEKPPYNGPTYISIFFELLSQYKKLISNQKLTTPSLDQCYQHEDNIMYNDAIASAQSCNLDISPIVNSKKLITNFPLTLAVNPFYQLLQDACDLRTQDPNTILTIASVLCLPAEKINGNTNR